MKIILSTVYIKMFKQISQGFSKFFTTQRVLVLVIFFVLAFVLYNYSDLKSSSRDGYIGKTKKFASPATTTMSPEVYMAPSADDSSAMMVPNMSSNDTLIPNPTMDTVETSNIEMMSNLNEGGYSPQNTGVPNGLLPLPQDNNKKFGNFDMINKGNIVMPDLLDAGYLIGLDTVGQTLKNANYQERSDPVIPKHNVGPWNNSTIEPDLGRVPLEIGSAMR